MSVISNHPLRCTVALAALAGVEDPEIGLPVTDLGLICQIDFDEPGKKIYVAMTLTTPFCPMGEALTTAVRQSMERHFPGEEVRVELIFEPPWTPDRISEAGRALLNR